MLLDIFQDLWSLLLIVSNSFCWEDRGFPWSSLILSLMDRDYRAEESVPISVLKCRFHLLKDDKNDSCRRDLIGIFFLLLVYGGVEECFLVW